MAKINANLSWKWNVGKKLSLFLLLKQNVVGNKPSFSLNLVIIGIANTAPHRKFLGTIPRFQERLELFPGLTDRPSCDRYIIGNKQNLNLPVKTRNLPKVLISSWHCPWLCMCMRNNRKKSRNCWDMRHHVTRATNCKIHPILQRK